MYIIGDSKYMTIINETNHVPSFPETQRYNVVHFIKHFFIDTFRKNIYPGIVIKRNGIYTLTTLFL